MTETPGLDMLASQRRLWDVIAIAAAVISLAAIVIFAVHAHHRPVVGAIVLVSMSVIFPGLMAAFGARNIGRHAVDGVPVGVWTRRAGWVRRTRTTSALRTSSPARVLLAVLLGVTVVWLLDLAWGLGDSLWQLLPLAVFMLMLTVAGQTGAARGAVRLAAQLDAGRIPAAALADVSPNDPLAVGALLREQATLRYGSAFVAAAAARCTTYRGSVLDLMQEVASAPI